MIKKNLICFIVLLFVFSAFGSDRPLNKGKVENSSNDIVYKEQCDAAIDYVTTLNYLREKNSQFKINDSDAQSVAMFVAKGCNNSSNRFTNVVDLLTYVGIDSGTAINTGKQFAHETDEKTNTFMTIFKGSFLKNYLDMDLLNAQKVALSLSTGLQKNPEVVQKDFMTISKFCASSKHLDLPKPKCGEYAVKILKATDEFKGSIGDAMTGLFDFMTVDDKGPKIPTYKALELIEEVLKYGPIAKDNFITAYRYAIGKKMNLPRGDAIKFAVELAKLSTR